MLEIKKCKFSEIEQCGTFRALFEEYCAEASIEGLPPPDEKFAAYRSLDSLDIFNVLGAFDDGELIGFISVLIPVMPHYGVAIGVSESFFVAGAKRKTGAGVKLLRRAEDLAREAGSPALMVSAPLGGRLATALPGLGYHETNRVFLRELNQQNMTIASMGSDAVDQVRALESESRKRPQVPITTQHTLHAGMYARTICIPANVLITGALIKIATILIVSGDAIVYGDDGALEITGYNVFSAQAFRKQAFVAKTDVHMTMLFPTNAKTVAEAESEFTDESDILISRREDSINLVTVG